MKEAEKKKRRTSNPQSPLVYWHCGRPIYHVVSMAYRKRYLSCTMKTNFMVEHGKPAGILTDFGFMLVRCYLKFWDFCDKTILSGYRQIYTRIHEEAMETILSYSKYREFLTNRWIHETIAQSNIEFVKFINLSSIAHCSAHIINLYYNNLWFIYFFNFQISMLLTE